MPNRRPKDTSLSEAVKLYLDIIWKHWPSTLSAILLTAIGTTLVMYVPPLVIAEIIKDSNNVFGIPVTETWHFLALFGGFWLAGEILWRIALYIMINFELKAIRSLYVIALEKLISKDLSFFHERFSGSITKNVLGFARRFEGFFDTIVFDITSALIPVLFAAGVLFFISPWLSAALIGTLIIGILTVRPLILRRMKLVKAREDAHATMSGHVSDVVSNVAAVKSFGNEDQEMTTHLTRVDDFITKASKSWHFQNTRIDTVISPIYVAANVLGLAIVMSLSVDASTKADLFIGYSYFANITRFLWAFNSIYRRLEEAITDASLFVAYLQVPNQVTDTAGAKELQATKGRVTFSDMTFNHDKESGALFTNFNLDIKAGQKVGLVGHSGAGKTTVTSLLLRFMDVDSGKIMIDGHDISTVTQQSLHKNISYVPQESTLFHRTLRENIAYGNPDATEDMIIDAAKQAHAWEFISQLPEGLDTMVGERGVKLSGGQRQRVSIARAILRDAPILVLDEATSALDSESEKLIQQSLTALMSDRTSIVVAHRLSTISKLDRIIVLDKGKIAEDGPHEELLAKKGIYAKLWNHQSGGFIEE